VVASFRDTGVIFESCRRLPAQTVQILAGSASRAVTETRAGLRASYGPTLPCLRDRALDLPAPERIGPAGELFAGAGNHIAEWGVSASSVPGWTRFGLLRGGCGEGLSTPESEQPPRPPDIVCGGALEPAELLQLIGGVVPGGPEEGQEEGQ
jgi:hypothetical protein